MSHADSLVGKVFVGGLAPQTTDEGLKQFFTGFGAVTKAQVICVTDPMTGTRRSRGFGFVTFESPTTADEVLTTREPILVDGKHVEVKRCEEDRTKSGGATDESRKIFVGGLPANCDGPMLKNYFLKIDPNVVEARVVMDPMTERSRGFGYVTFSSPEMVGKAIAQRDSHYMGEKWIDVKASVPQTKGKGKGKAGAKGFDAYGAAASAYGAKGYGKGAYAPAPAAYPAYDYSAYYAAAAAQPAYDYAAQVAAAQSAQAYGAYTAAAAPPAAAYAAYAQPAAAPAADPYAAYAAQYAAAAAAQQPATTAAAAPAYGIDQSAYAAYAAAPGGAYAGYGAGAYGQAATAAAPAAYGAAGYRPQPY